MSRKSLVNRNAFTGIWTNKEGSKGPAGSDYRCALIFFEDGGENWSARFNRDDDYVYPGAYFGTYTVNGNEIHYEFPYGNRWLKLTVPWQVGKDGSIILHDPDGADHMVPSTLEAATAYASSPEVIREFLAEARKEGWVIDRTARVPDVTPASATATAKKPKR